MTATHHKISALALTLALLCSLPLRGESPADSTGEQSEENPSSQQSIQQALKDLRRSAEDFDRRLTQLESLLRADQESPAASPASHLQVWAMDSDGRNARQVAYAPEFPIINSPEVSPEGRFVAVDGWKANESLTAAKLLLLDLKSGEVRDLGIGAMPNWSPDGNWIAYCKYGNERGVYVGSVDGKSERHLDPRGWGIQWSPDGSQVVYSRDGKLVVHHFFTAESREVVPAGWDYTYIYWNPTWSPDSKEVCIKARHNDGHDEFAIVNVTSDVPSIRRRVNADGFHEDIAWHPDGTRILIPKAPADGAPGQIYAFDPNESDEPTPLAGQPADRHNGGMCWSRDGKTLFFTSLKVQGPSDAESSTNP